jgi:heme/copper-type cytochrome/quinol oxidase subunit 3
LIFFSLFSFIIAWAFISLQIKEFRIMGLSINDSVYSSLFFFLTGLHFFHLLLGLFLLSLFFWGCSFRIKINLFLNLRISVIHSFNNLQLFYWHFLEILWLFIFLFLYSLWKCQSWQAPSRSVAELKSPVFDEISLVFFLWNFILYY